MKSSRFSRPKGHVGTALTFAMPFGLLGLTAGILADQTLLGIGLFGFAVLNRLILATAAGWTVVGDRRALSHSWLYPVRDFMGFCFWAASFLGTTIVWRGERYKLAVEGKMARIPSRAVPASRPVAVDDLA
jgi:ceramide glucosyltransferase